MAEKKFQKQKLNKEDHKRVDDMAKNVRNRLEIGGILLLTVGVLPKLIKTFTKS